MRHRATDDDGVSIVELVVYISIAALFVTVLAILFVSSLALDRETRDRDAATRQAERLMRDLSDGVRNSSEYQFDGDIFRARVAVDGGWQCRAWRFQGEQLSIASYLPGNAEIFTAALGDVDSLSITESEGRLLITVTVGVGGQEVTVTGGAVPLAKARGGDSCLVL